jgi:hypothetical protein
MVNHDDWRQKIDGMVQFLVSMMYADWTLVFLESAKGERLNILYLLSPSVSDKEVTLTYSYRINPRPLPAHVSPAHMA